MSVALLLGAIPQRTSGGAHTAIGSGRILVYGENMIDSIVEVAIHENGRDHLALISKDRGYEFDSHFGGIGKATMHHRGTESHISVKVKRIGPPSGAMPHERLISPA